MKPYNDIDSKRDQIRTMFDRIAPAYDLLNHLLSFGIDRRWRRRVVKLVREDRPARILDLATGTGDMALALARGVPGAQVTGADLSTQMLEVAREKVAKKGLTERIRLCVAEAEQMPEMPDNGFDVTTVAFGVRNFHDIGRGLREICRTLRPGGKLYVLEFSTPRNGLFGALYRFYFHRVLPVIGGWVSHDGKAYRYLPESVDEFPAWERFVAMMEECGYGECRSVALMTGVARIYIGVKQ